MKEISNVKIVDFIENWGNNNVIVFDKEISSLRKYQEIYSKRFQFELDRILKKWSKEEIKEYSIMPLLDETLGLIKDNLKNNLQGEVVTIMEDNWELKDLIFSTNRKLSELKEELHSRKVYETAE